MAAISSGQRFIDGWSQVGKFGKLLILARGPERKLLDPVTGRGILYRAAGPADKVYTGGKQGPEPNNRGG